MTKILKAKRRKTKTKAKTKPATRTKAKTQKTKIKTKIGKVATMRVSLKLPDKVKRNEPRPATQQIHAAAVEKKDYFEPEVLPKISYKLEVDGRLKSEHPTQEAALTAALELKRKFPQIRVAIIDTKGPKRIAVELPQATG
jgi:hypothetical protein